jgi:ATP-dependent DNA ligase
VDSDGAVVFRQACVMGLEGIVAKRRDSRYRSGRCRDWIKIKNMAHPAIERAMLIMLSKRRRGSLHSGRLDLPRWRVPEPQPAPARDSRSAKTDRLCDAC